METYRRHVDSLWFVDLPTQEERENVFNIHIRKVKRDPKNFDVSTMAKESDGYTGAEIMNSIKSAMFSAFYEDREFTTKDILIAIKETVPMIKTKNTVIERLRAWGKDNARYANGSVKETKKESVTPVWNKKISSVTPIKR